MSSANSDSFTSLLIWIPFISFSFYFIFLFLWLLWLKLPKLCWIIVVRLGNLVFFLILVEMVPVFHHWEQCWLWVCHRWPLLCWGKFPLCLLSGEFFIINGCWILSKAFSASIEIIIWFLILQFVNMVYHIYWFVYIEESLDSWDKPHLIMVYDPFNVLLDSVC